MKLLKKTPVKAKARRVPTAPLEGTTFAAVPVGAVFTFQKAPDAGRGRPTHWLKTSSERYRAKAGGEAFRSAKGAIVTHIYDAVDA